MTVLLINRSDSRCGACGQDAKPTEERHNTVLGYGPTRTGCGVRWTHVSSDYMGSAMEAACRQMRPDLKWVDPHQSVALLAAQKVSHSDERGTP